jgi:hypothetical protein
LINDGGDAAAIMTLVNTLGEAALRLPLRTKALKEVDC